MIPAERGHRSADISDLTVKKSRTSQDRLLAGRRARRRRHAVHPLHAIGSSGGALLHHRAVAICRLRAASLRAVRHPYALGCLERGMGAMLRSGAPFIMAGHLTVIGRCRKGGNRCGKCHAQCGAEMEHLHDSIPLAKSSERPSGGHGKLPRLESAGFPTAVTAARDQPRRVGGGGSGARSLPTNILVIGQKACAVKCCGVIAGGTGAFNRTTGTMQPITAMQSKVSPLQGFSAGCCCCIIFMQSSVIPAMFIDADAADAVGGTVAKTAS